MDLDQALQTFIAESRELLEEMEAALLGAEHAESRDELVNAIFRAAHTIKGSAGLFGLDEVVGFTHVVESVLDAVRDGRVELSRELTALLLSCGDHLSALVNSVAAGETDLDGDMRAAGEQLHRGLRTYLDDSGAAAEPATATAGCCGPAADGAEAIASDLWHVSLRFGRDTLRNGMDPASFIAYLGKLGRVVSIVTVPDAIPDIRDMDPESCYLGFEIAFESAADKAAIADVFEFVRDDCTVRILPPRSRISEYVALIGALPEGLPRIGEILMQCGSLTESELAAALHAQGAEVEGKPLGRILIESNTVPTPVVEAALEKQGRMRAPVKAQETRSIRVDADKLDHLINLVGELIIAGASADLVARRAQVAELQECTSAFTALVEEVRDSALQLRMVKIGGTFSKFQRVVHDVARELGKDIELVVSGEDTELDKTVVENIGDPLTHLVRNSMDHGIESAAVRAGRGKPARGTVKLNAYHDSGSIVIEVSDDGGGLDRDRILAKGIERGLVEPGRQLTDREIFRLIFEPGFSTADKVTNLSGRGVGMDVVKRNISALRGSIDVDSAEGAGTTVRIRLPLTLAIIDGFLVGLAKSTFVVPLDMIEECVEFSAEPGHDYTNLRGEVLPFIRLREVFEITGAKARRESIVVVRHAGRKVGLVVDALLGEFQTVIKPLGSMFNHVDCISGSTILGSGEVALILDVPALITQALDHEAQPASPFGSFPPAAAIQRA